MKTVKEISTLTGISVRTLHYYDEIGLLKPSAKSQAGYRLYDDKALETLQQILFFREFDISLKEIKNVLENPALDRDKILKLQRKMLAVKKERLERLIANIDAILKGENEMNFEIFTRAEVEELCQSTIDHMPDFMCQSIIREFGSLEKWRRHYVERCSSKDMQKGYQKMVEWYGDKESALKAMNNPPSQEVGQAFAKRIEDIERRLSEKRKSAESASSFEIRQLIGEYGFVMKRFSQVRHEGPLMLSIASNYREKPVSESIDKKYGNGTSDFFANAIEEFYGK